MRVISTLLAGAVLAASSLTAMAAPLDERAAGKVLFSGDRFRVQVLANASIDATTMAQVEALAKLLENPQYAIMFADSGYYGAIAVIPGQVFDEKSMSISARLHNPQAAAEAAVKECNALDGPACVAVALVLPKRYKTSELSLSQAATESFNSQFAELSAPKYFAYSPSTPVWSVTTGTGAGVAAVENCNTKAAEFGASDCVIGIAEQ